MDYLFEDKILLPPLDVKYIDISPELFARWFGS